MRRIAFLAVLVTGGAFLALMPGLVQASAPKAPHKCSGTATKPGVLKGRYTSGVLVTGLCEVNAGPAHVIGTVTVAKNAALGAAFGLHHSALKISGNLIVDQGGIAVLGCRVNADGSGFPCLDDPNMSKPTLRSHAVVTGSITANAPLSVLVHNSSIGRNVTETGGGGGLSCAVPKTGIFAEFKSPVYSDYEDASVGGSMVIKDKKSCWLGVGRVDIEGSLTISQNQMADPDAIEVLANYISKNLSCSGNGHPAGMPAGAEPLWDSTEATFGSAIYPRSAEPNTVEGTRSGQCVHATPTAQGGPSAGLF